VFTGRAVAETAHQLALLEALLAAGAAPDRPSKDGAARVISDCRCR
jgi:hypothetical protein